jgi:DNA gyrase subunit A
MPIVNLLTLEPNERITAAVAVPDFKASEYIMVATVRGRVKRMQLSDFESVRVSGLIAITLEEGDELDWASLTSGKDDLIMVTSNGNALRVNENDFRPMGRSAKGVTGIKLADGDKLTSMDVVLSDSFLLVVTEKGYGKRTELKQYRTQGRATKGVATIDQKMVKTIGHIVSARVVEKDDSVSFITTNGLMLRVNVNDITKSGRTTKGVHLMNLEKGDSVASIARISEAKK